MKKLYYLILILGIIGLITLLVSCPEEGDGFEDTEAESSYSGSGDEVFHIDTNEAVDLTHTLHLGSHVADIYYVFTNTNPYTNMLHPEIMSKGDTIVESRDLSSQLGIERTGPVGRNGKPEIAAYNRDVHALLEKDSSSRDVAVLPDGPMKDDEGQEEDFYYDLDLNFIEAKCRESRTVGTKTLNIYVADDCWETDGSKPNLVTDEMVTEMADKFLLTGTDNDIYDWITAIFGEEWGTHIYSNLITDNDNITILLYDIDNDNIPTGPFTMGFFWAKDNFRTTSEPASNGRIMFYLDAVMYANYHDYDGGSGNGEWNITDYWPGEMISTLAHEFQHMIHYYQKAIKAMNNGYNSETWIDEMCATVAEDFVADKILANGPRGVTFNDYTAGDPDNNFGRLPLFNYTNDYSLTNWESQLNNYSTVYAFGAYMARNFGGVQLFREIVQNQPTNYQAIDQALSATGYSNEDFASLLQKWGASILLSDNISPPTGHYQYNAGDYFASTLSSINYNLGSINLYNYTYSPQTGPYIYTSSPIGAEVHTQFNSASNRLFLVGNNLTGDVVNTVRMDNGVKLTVVVKE